MSVVIRIAADGTHIETLYQDNVPLASIGEIELVKRVTDVQFDTQAGGWSANFTAPALQGIPPTSLQKKRAKAIQDEVEVLNSVLLERSILNE